jgi:hypothetical protein
MSIRPIQLIAIIISAIAIGINIGIALEKMQ